LIKVMGWIKETDRKCEHCSADIAHKHTHTLFDSKIIFWNIGVICGSLKSRLTLVKRTGS